VISLGAVIADSSAEAYPDVWRKPGTTAEQYALKNLVRSYSGRRLSCARRKPVGFPASQFTNRGSSGVYASLSSR